MSGLICAWITTGLLFLVGATSAAGSRESLAPTFRAGAASSNITPALGTKVRLGALESYPISAVHDDWFARCLILDDGTTRIAFVSCDLMAIDREVADEAKRQIEKVTRMPPSAVVISAVHTHAPNDDSDVQAPLTLTTLDAYHQFLAQRIADAVQRAVQNLTPARVGWGHGRLPGYVHNRRWFTRSVEDRKNPYGGIDQVRMNPPSGPAQLIEPAGPVDPGIPFFAVQTAEGRPLALMANYSLHYVGGVNSPGEVSADYFGYFADSIQRLLGADRLEPAFVGMLTNGASADIISLDWRLPRVRQKPYERMKVVANEVAAEVYRAFQNVTFQSWARLGIAYRELPLATRRPSPEVAARSRQILAAPTTTSPTHARERSYAAKALAMAELPDETRFSLYAIRIGDLAIFTLPVETFVEIGLELKQRSAFPTTMVIGLANGYFGYLPTPRQHELGGYETWLGTSRVEPRASEKVVATLLEMQEGLR